MAHLIKTGDFANHVDDIISRGLKIDRIITDFPSFYGRFWGCESKDKINLLITKLIKLIKSDLFSANGSLTISITGEPQQFFEEWVANEGAEFLEHIPEADHSVFSHYMMDLRDRSMFIGRRDNWASVKTYRRKGGDFTPNVVEPITNVPNRFANFPLPDVKEKYTIHSYRSPVHHGINEAREDLVWLAARGLDDNIDLQNKHLRKPPGVLVNFNLDRGTWLEFPGGVVYGDTPYITQELADKIQSQDNNPGLYRLVKTVHTNYAMWLVQMFSNEGEVVYNPFMELGEVAAATMICKRQLIGVEMNEGRWSEVRKMHLQLLSA